MKKSLLLAAAVLCSGCTSVEWTSVSSTEVVANGGEAIAVIQASAIGVTAIFHIIDIVPCDLDVAVNKVLVAEAKKMGASKVDLKSASATPRQGVFAIYGTLIGLPTATAVGVAVK
jgi:hypothetical protein